MTYEESLLIIANNILQIESNTEKIQYLTKELDNAIVSGNKQLAQQIEENIISITI